MNLHVPSGPAGAIEPLIRRHAEDAAFYWKQLDSSLSEPGRTARGILEFALLMEAHLDGLSVAGAAAVPAAREALERWRKPGEAFAASHAALHAGSPEVLAAVIAQVARMPDLLLRGLISALACSPAAAAQAFMTAAWQQLDEGTPSAHTQLVAALRACALRDMPLPAEVRRPALRHRHPAVRAAACRASVGTPDLEALLQDPDLAARAEAAIALRGDSMQAASVLWHCVAEQVPHSRQATGWHRVQAQRRLARWLRHLAQLAPLGHADVASLLAFLPLREALRFVLFHGDPAHLGFVVGALTDPEQGRWAGLVWQCLTGVDLAANGLTAPEPPFNLDAPLTRSRQDGDQGLPLPNPAAVSAHAANAQLAAWAGQGVLMGRPVTLALLAELLRIETDAPQLLRAVAVHAWNAERTTTRIRLRGMASEQLARNRELAMLISLEAAA